MKCTVTITNYNPSYINAWGLQTFVINMKAELLRGFITNLESDKLPYEEGYLPKWYQNVIQNKGRYSSGIRIYTKFPMSITDGALDFLTQLTMFEAIYEGVDNIDVNRYRDIPVEKGVYKFLYEAVKTSADIYVSLRNQYFQNIAPIDEICRWTESDCTWEMIESFYEKRR